VKLTRLFDGAEVEGFELGGDEHAQRPPQWFYDACTANVAVMSRAEDNSLSVAVNGQIARQGDWVVLQAGGLISTVKASEFDTVLARANQ
jgi:hypothetical protein